MAVHTKPSARRIQDASSVDETLALMKARLSGVVAEADMPRKAEMAFAINRLKHERNAIVLGHNYMEPALYHSVPDHVGDSLQLSRQCVGTKADIIVFCGVRFMAETAKVLNPDKTVLIPSLEAGCSLAEGISAQQVRELKRVYPGAPVITYVNTYADVKAESDCSCTSGNATAVLRHYVEEGHERILFLPDEFLAHNTANALGLAFVVAPESLEDVPENLGVVPGKPTVIGCRVHCEVHEQFTPEHVRAVRAALPDAVILAHPECAPEVMALVDVAGSTKKMVEYLRDVDAAHYVLLTDASMAENLAAEYPHRDVVRPQEYRCRHMQIITLEQTLAALENRQYQIALAPDVIARATAPIRKMLEIL
ncbi:MAG TPA: quinolinate synthase NadA [Candidatus Hydrogenedentes bacterium]|nr:quinolinate synthase NadA [Candidatus Hydrogenedentota bacterium]HPG66145.1 quinolinate synthase NadA [Candidatus Hydrogenedentota bacterium]